jgi:malonate decarboxylase epsilon subunit
VVAGAAVSVGFVYPGEGVRLGPVLDDLPDVTAVHETLSEADTLMPGGLGSLDHPPAGTNETVSSQLGLLIRGVAASRVLAAEGALPDIVAGHSVGAFPAAVAAGALKFSDAVRAVSFRAHRMAEMFPSGFGMLAVIGMSHSAVSEVVEQLNGAGENVWLANVNSYEQMVLSGTDAALQEAETLVKTRGALRVERLRVNIASHGPRLESVAAGLRSMLGTPSDRTLVADYVMISSARRARNAEEVLGDLAASVATAVQWRDAFGVLVELGARFVLQLPPGHTLVGLADSILTHDDITGVDVRAMSDETLSDCVYRIHRSSRRAPSAT